MKIKSGFWKKVFISIFTLQAGVNLIGALGPEISFDALYYHLPIARLIGERGWWGVIPGGLLYTSAMPKLWEFVNAGILLAGDEISVKIVHWLLGLLSAGMIYKIARRYWGKTASWMGVVMWYSSLVVGWQSMVVYVDLVRVFFVLWSLWWALEYLERDRKKAWMVSALIMGIAYSVKFLSILDGVFVGLVLGSMSQGRGLRSKIKVIAGYWGIVGLFVLSWGLINLLSGYQIYYPFISDIGFIQGSMVSSVSYFSSLLIVFFSPVFRTGPLVLIMLIIGWKKIRGHKLRSLVLVSLALVAGWYVVPLKGQGRYFLPSLAILSSLAAGAWHTKGSRKNLAVIAAVIAGLSGIFYRGAANLKFVPYLLGQESKQEFLVRELNFYNGEWYDIDQEVGKIVGDERYIVYGVHNTYYLPGRFDHFSFADPDYCYKYILVQGEDRPEMPGRELLYESKINKSELYLNECR